MRNPDTHHSARRQAIQRLLSVSPVATQEELRQRLVGEGFSVTQTTLSRDLARLGARRVGRPGGRARYTFDGLPALGSTALELGDLVLDVRHNRDLAVVHTRPGAASAIARVIDEARLDEVLGSLAGDDTIFVAPSLHTSTRKLASKLQQLFGKDS